METQESLKKQLDNTKDFQSVVKTMKAISAVSIRQYTNAVEALQGYNNNVEKGFSVLMHNAAQDVLSSITSEPLERTGAVVFGSEQGMCGQFNNDIVSFALKQLNDLVNDPRNNFIISVGSRVHPILAAENQKIDQRFTHPGSVQGITPSVQHLILYIEEWILRSGVNRVLLFYNKKETGSSYRSKMLHMYPLNKDWLFEINRQKWPGKSLPNMYMDWRAILSVLTRQYFFVSLYTAFAESLASENASRLAAMQAAEKNIDERLQDLSSRYNHVRQSSITSELLDMAAGFEALEGGTEG